MSFKKVVLIAAAVALFSPMTTLADGIQFGIQSGHLNVIRPFVPGSTGSTYGSVGLRYISESSGNSALGSADSPPIGTAPTSAGIFKEPIGAFNFGTLSFTTGPVINMGANSATFDAQGSITITSNAGLAMATGGAIPSGTLLFKGIFNSPTTLTQSTFCSSDCRKFNFNYSLSGMISGTLDPAVMNTLGLSGNPDVHGFFQALMFGFVGPEDSTGRIEGGAASIAAVPEPGSLALFGTGLMGIAAFIRRRLTKSRAYSKSS